MRLLTRVIIATVKFWSAILNNSCRPISVITVMNPLDIAFVFNYIKVTRFRVKSNYITSVGVL